MQCRRLPFLALVLVTGTACARAPDVAQAASLVDAGQGDGSSAVGADASVPVDEPIVGRVFFTTAVDNMTAMDQLDVDLQPFTPLADPCSGASLVVGACCFFPPPQPPPLQSPGSGSGTPSTEESAGPIRLVDTTTGSTIGTYLPGNGDYPGIPPSYPAGTWSPGDVLTVSAEGAAIGPFTLSAPALAPPTSIVPPTVVRGQDLVITWTPDPASDTILVRVDDLHGAIVACIVPEAQGSVTMDASLFASFVAGPGETESVRETDRFATVPTGRVELSSFGWAGGQCTVE